MRLVSLFLKNIRSYKELELNFREGITLLTGDIGSGKTTILLSIEFALLGLHTDITGTTLLRHGESQGEIRLTLQINEEQITICRKLKRSNSGVKQEAGYIETGKGRLDLTAREIKTKVIELLGYPKELAEKNKDVIFRYTIYTPQEEMKSILYEKSEDRIEKIRKIFGIDKYKLIKENTVSIAREIRSNNKYLEAKIEEEPKLKQEITSIKEEIDDYKKELEQVIKETSKLKELEKKQKEELEKQEEQQRIIQQKIAQKKLLESQLENEIEKQELTKKRIKRLEEEIKKEIKKPEEIDKKNYEQLIKELDEKLEVVSLKKQKAKEQIAIFESESKNAKNRLDNIEELDMCTLCQQPINETHKVHVEKKENKIIKDNKEKISKYEEYVLKAKKIEDKYKLEKDELYKKQLKQKELVYLNKRFEEKLKERDKLKQEVEELKKESHDKKIKEIQEKISLIKIKEETTEFKEAKQKYDFVLNELREVERKKQKYELKIEYENKSLSEKKTKIEDIKVIRQKIAENKVTENWLDKQFLPLIDNIEKHVLNSVYNEFNERFKTWFEILLEQETITSELDEDFAPKINQNGFDTDITNLSGGEKTATALAYRLALNKTINDYVSDINTKDLIILDEPTDGFSSDQLDKLRDVIEQLNNKQTIIVSHEAKLESMAEHIIQLRKHEHESEVV
ncbi:MAG: AAA family ATPase [Candidatus Woesearchaeota archaeon]